MINLDTVLNSKSLFLNILLPLSTFLIGWISPKLRKFIRFRSFSKSFGDVVKEHKSIIVAVPLWKVKEAASTKTRFSKTYLDGCYMEDYGPSETLAVADLGAIQEIGALISKFHPNPPEFILDTERSLDRQTKTLIAIGAPIANVRTKNALKVMNQDFFDFIDQEETADHPARSAIIDKKTNIIYDCAGDLEYAMVLRLESMMTKGSYVFILAGPHAEGTHAAGLFLRKNWSIFINAQPNSGVLLGMPRREFNKYWVEKKYGFNERWFNYFPFL